MSNKHKDEGHLAKTLLTYHIFDFSKSQQESRNSFESAIELAVSIYKLRYLNLMLPLYIFEFNFDNYLFRIVRVLL